MDHIIHEEIRTVMQPNQHAPQDITTNAVSCAKIKVKGKMLLLCCADYECKSHGDPRGYCAPKVLRLKQLLRHSGGWSL